MTDSDSKYLDLIEENKQLKLQLDVFRKGEGRKKRFIYVLAYYPEYAPDELAFEAAVVEAMDTDDAYYVGMTTVDDNVLKKGRLANNFVVCELP